MLAVSNALQVIALVGATASYLCLFFAAGDHDGPPVPDELGNATLDEAGSAQRSPLLPVGPPLLADTQGCPCNLRLWRLGQGRGGGTGCVA